MSPEEGGAMKAAAYQVVRGGYISADDVRQLFGAVGWTDEASLDDQSLKTAFHESYFTISARDDDGNLIGVIRASFDGMYLLLWNLVVDPKWQSTGIGSELLRMALQEAHLRGHKWVVGLALNEYVAYYGKRGLLPVDHLTVVTTYPNL